MAQKFEIGLNAKINDFAKKFSITRTDKNDEDVFEDFGNHVIASNLMEEELENVKTVSTNKSKGIDGTVIIVNNRIVTEEADLGKIGSTETIKIKMGFIQSTTISSFDEQKLSSFTDYKIVYLGKYLNAKDVFIKTVNLLNSKNYLFERRGLYSNPKTEKLIQEIINVPN